MIISVPEIIESQTLLDALKQQIQENIIILTRLHSVTQTRGAKEMYQNTIAAFQMIDNQLKSIKVITGTADEQIQQYNLPAGKIVK